MKDIKNQQSEDFYSSNFTFFNYGPSQLSLIMIQNLIESQVFSICVKKLNLRQIVLDVLRESALTEFQIAVWALVLVKNGIKESNFSIRDILFFSALKARELLGESNSHIIKKFRNKDPEFSKNYNIWKKNNSLIEIKIKDINHEYSRLIVGKTRRINYNYYTDDILAQYIPYKKTKRKNEELILNPIFVIKDRSYLKSRENNDKEELQKLIDISNNQDDYLNLDEISSFLYFDSR